MRMPMIRTESEVAEEISDKLFFEQFYTRYKNFLYYTARRKCNNEDDVHEVVQETIVRLLKNINALREINEAKTQKYIALTVRAVYVDLEKKKHTDMAVSLNEALIEVLHCGGTQIEREMEGIDHKNNIRKLQAGLSTRDWYVLESKYILGYTDQELAAHLGVAPDSIRMILSRAKSKARAILQPANEKGGDRK